MIQHALVAASELEFPYNSLTTTALIKLVYIADLVHAERHGMSFTGARWLFLHFGPWAAMVDARLEPATRAIGGEIRTFDGGIAFGAGRGTEARPPGEVPVVVRIAVRSAVVKFQGETSRLLHFVYRTGPMLRAAPEEELTFALVPDLHDRGKAPGSLSSKQKKELREQAALLRAGANGRAHEERAVRVPVSSQYDDVYVHGVDWLESMASAFPEFEGTAVVDDSMWRSPARGEPSND